MPIFKNKRQHENPEIKYHISDQDYYWLVSRFCQNMMAFVLSATRFNADNSAYFEQFFIHFLDRRGIKYVIKNIDDQNRQLVMVKPWDKASEICER
ncbi:MAG TPA: hypothetical protein VEG44_09245 [Candidatus Acidoferrales bacterium]|nr:hypothetical protein [Candidatus Acidoferrales bacterium]